MSESPGGHGVAVGAGVGVTTGVAVGFAVAVGTTITGVAAGVGDSIEQLLPWSSQSTYELFQQKRHALTELMRTTASAAETKARIEFLGRRDAVRM